ncbi:MAG TPA: phosphodiester glycosidase family protein [Candidatus Faecousia faecavium]|nr:phosphodiester glycosidase family protein [Candidatus Faecousia faecavium]
MNKKNQVPDRAPHAVQGASGGKQPKKKKSGLMGRIVRRFFLLLFTVILLAFAALVLVMNLVFNGPSPAARTQLTMSLIEASATKWVPALFIGEEAVEEIRASDKGAELKEEVTDTSQVVINKDSAMTSNSDEWEKYPDGIRIESYSGDTYNAHIMIVKDPSQVYMGISTEKFSTSIPGKRLNAVIEEEGALAAINAGAFNDDGTASASVGSCPLGLVMSGGKCVWTSGKQPGLEGFAGFNTDNILVVSKTNLSQSEAEQLNIRDGCCFGPALIINGEINGEAYNSNSGLNPRTAIGQRADGAVIFVCIDGRQTSSMGGTYADIIDIMVEYGAVNACNMDGGSSSIMYYRDTYGRYGEAGQVQMINNYSLLQSQPRRMPNYWLVRAAE